MTKKKIKPPPRRVYILFDREGEPQGFYPSRDDAEADAWGPRFRPYTIRVYALLPKKGE